MYPFVPTVPPDAVTLAAPLHTPLQLAAEVLESDETIAGGSETAVSVVFVHPIASVTVTV